MTVCKKCGGSGWDDEHMIKCLHCHGSGEVEMTNEEWLRGASANDMARCIATKLLELARHEYGIYDVVDYATVFEWLKKPHNS